MKSNEPMTKEQIIVIAEMSHISVEIVEEMAVSNGYTIFDVEYIFTSLMIARDPMATLKNVIKKHPDAKLKWPHVNVDYYVNHLKAA